MDKTVYTLTVRKVHGTYRGTIKELPDVEEWSPDRRTVFELLVDTISNFEDYHIEKGFIK